MGRYAKKMAEKNKLQYAMVKRIYLDDFDTYVESTGDGMFAIRGKNSAISVDKSGNINISGSMSVKLQGKNLDFNELPDRYIRPSGVTWEWIRNNTSIVGALPIRIKGKKVFIPFLDVEF